jgi:hypothetical protein
MLLNIACYYNNERGSRRRANYMDVTPLRGLARQEKKGRGFRLKYLGKSSIYGKIET